MPINWKSKVILFKIEPTYGVDAVPTGAANAMLMTNVSFSPMEGEDVTRDLELPYLSAEPMIPVGLRGRLKGRIELVPSGSLGVAPSWGPMLRCCAVAQTINAGVSVVYNPISAGMESGTLYFWMGGTRHVLTGCRGNAEMKFTAQNLPYLEFDMLGLWTTPSEVAPAAPTLGGFQLPVVVTKTNTPVLTINAVAMIGREVTLALNNQVEPRLLIGSESIIIPDRSDTFSARVEAVATTLFNPYALANAQTKVAAALTHGTVAGFRAALTMPAVQLKRLSGFENAQNTLEWPLEMVPLPVNGNDQWALTLT